MYSEVTFVNTYDFTNSIIRRYLTKFKNLVICTFNKEAHILHILNTIKSGELIIFDGLDNIQYEIYDKYSLMNFIRNQSILNNFTYKIL